MITVQEIIDALGKGYDLGLLTREDVYERLEKLVEGTNFKKDTVDRLFDIIVG